MNLQTERRFNVGPERIVPPFSVQLPGVAYGGHYAQVAPSHHGYRLQPRWPPNARLLLIGPRLRLRPVPGMAWMRRSISVSPWSSGFGQRFVS